MARILSIMDRRGKVDSELGRVGRSWNGDVNWEGEGCSSWLDVDVEQHQKLGMF